LLSRSFRPVELSDAVCVGTIQRVPTSLCLELEALDVGGREAVGSEVLADFGWVRGVVVARAGGLVSQLNAGEV
jgi:hypothetical protein